MTAALPGLKALAALFSWFLDISWFWDEFLDLRRIYTVLTIYAVSIRDFVSFDKEITSFDSLEQCKTVVLARVRAGIIARLTIITVLSRNH